MFNYNRIMFGYGTISTKTIVIKSKKASLIFSHINKPQIIGTDLVTIKDIKKTLLVEFNFDNDFYDLLKELSKINENNSEIYFRGYILDFSKYNYDSVRCVYRSVNYIINAMSPF